MCEPFTQTMSLLATKLQARDLIRIPTCTSDEVSSYATTLLPNKCILKCTSLKSNLRKMKIRSQYMNYCPYSPSNSLDRIIFKYKHFSKYPRLTDGVCVRVVTTHRSRGNHTYLFGVLTSDFYVSKPPCSADRQTLLQEPKFEVQHCSRARA